MRLLVDLQACQTPHSRQRGIGNYSLAHTQELVRQAGDHEVWLLLNDRFPDTIPGLIKAFDGLVPPQQMRIFNVPEAIAEVGDDSRWRGHAARLLRQQAIAAVAPDIVQVASLFEGLNDDAVTHIEPSAMLRNSVTLYDLIPYIYSDRYLPDENQRLWYHRKLQSLKNSDLALAISESSRREGIDLLGLSADRVVNISSAIDSRFRQVTLTPTQHQQLLARYGIRRDFVMYTGGADYRKNIDGLVRAWALLPAAVHLRHQLAVVCNISAEDRATLQALAQAAGLSADAIIFTGYVPFDDLLGLYSSAKLFTFPSLHEGFGLPVLEAMACGTPTIGADAASIPEVIGRQDALFDPRSPQAIADKIAAVLADGDFRAELARFGLQRAQQFSWRETARRSWDAFTDLHERQRAERATGIALPATTAAPPARRPRLAFVSPLPPVQSGIADYCADLLPALARYYDIELVLSQEPVVSDWLVANFPMRSVDWFLANADRYDRVVYQFGNNQYHAHMFDLVDQVPGAVVMHDFYLGHVIDYLDRANIRPGLHSEALRYSHGLRSVPRAGVPLGDQAVVSEYPANRPILESALGVIVHSRFSFELGAQWYGEGFNQGWAQLPLARRLPAVAEASRRAARERLGIAEQELVVCSFGFVNGHKCHHELLEAWLGSPLAARADARLVIVGHNNSDRYGAKLEGLAGRGAGRITVTGYTQPATYQDWLLAADVAVQLRRDSRGETSGTILDCLAYGLPLIFNHHGAAAELSDEVGYRLPEVVEPAGLAVALEALAADSASRARFAAAGRRYIAEAHAPELAAARYHEALERFHHNHWRVAEQRTLADIALAPGATIESVESVGAVAAAVRRNRPGARQLLLIEVSAALPQPLRELCRHWLEQPPAGWYLEPVMQRPDGLFEANGWAQALLDLRSAPPELRVNPPLGTRWLRLGGAAQCAELPANVLVEAPAWLPATVTGGGFDRAALDKALAEWLATGRFLAPLQSLLAPVAAEPVQPAATPTLTAIG